MCFRLHFCWNPHILFEPTPHSIGRSPRSIHSLNSFWFIIYAMDVIHQTCSGHLLWKTHGGSEVVLLSRWKLTLGIFPPLAPVVSRQSLGRLRASLQSVPAPGNRGSEWGGMRRDKRDKPCSALHDPAIQGWDKQEGHRGWAGMRKSAVSVRSGAGMPAHMATERNTGGGEEGGCKEGTVWPITLHLERHSRCHFVNSLESLVYFHNNN